MVIWIYGMMDMGRRRTEDMLREEEEARQQEEDGFRQSSNPDVPFISLPDDTPNPQAEKTFGYENYGQGVYQPSGSFEDGRRTIKMTVRRYAFEPDFIVVYEGETVELDVTSMDMLHGLQIKSYNIERALPRGERRTITFVADRPGRHEFRSQIYCGPEQHLMAGELIVIADPSKGADNPGAQAVIPSTQAASPSTQAPSSNAGDASLPENEAVKPDEENTGQDGKGERRESIKPDAAAAPAEPRPPTLTEAARRQMNRE